MRLLLDTHVLLAAGGASRRLPSSIVDLLLDENNDLFVSSVSIWEIASKHSLRKLPLAVPPRKWTAQIIADIDALELPFTSAHALMIEALPVIHRDPFDRMLICQAKVEELTIVTADEAFHQYDFATFW